MIQAFFYFSISWLQHTYFLLYSVLQCQVLAEYVPGTPGGPWTSDEIDIVRDRILALINPIREAQFAMFGKTEAMSPLAGPVSGYERYK